MSRNYVCTEVPYGRIYRSLRAVGEKNSTLVLAIIYRCNQRPSPEFQTSRRTPDE